MFENYSCLGSRLVSVGVGVRGESSFVYLNGKIIHC